MTDYESAWKHLKQYVSDMEYYSKPYKGNGFRAVLYKMEELEKALTTEEPKEESITLDDEAKEKFKLMNQSVTNLIKDFLKEVFNDD